MRMQIYFSDEESNYVKEQPAGYVRKLVQNDMGGGSDIEGYPVEPPIKVVVPPKISSVVKQVPIKVKGDGLRTCKSCGSVLPYYKGKCKNC